MDIKDVWERPSTIWALVAASGSQGMSFWHVCVYFICLPPGKLMHRIFSAGLSLLTGVTWRKKCPVVPTYAVSIYNDILLLDVLNTVWIRRLLGSIFIFILRHYWWRNDLLFQMLAPYCCLVNDFLWLFFISSSSRYWYIFLAKLGVGINSHWSK